jgi:hypothetical protein
VAKYFVLRVMCEAQAASKVFLVLEGDAGGWDAMFTIPPRQSASKSSNERV